MKLQSLVDARLPSSYQQQLHPPNGTRWRTRAPSVDISTMPRRWADTHNSAVGSAPSATVPYRSMSLSGRDNAGAYIYVL